MRGLLTALPLVAATLLAGCGQRGDLFLPGAAEPAVVEQTAPDDGGDQETETNDEQDEG